VQMANGCFPDLPQGCFPGFPAVFPLVCSRVLRWFFPYTKAELQFTKKSNGPGDWIGIRYEGNSVLHWEVTGNQSPVMGRLQWIQRPAPGHF
jgi:hypothetical protein